MEVIWSIKSIKHLFNFFPWLVTEEACSNENKIPLHPRGMKQLLTISGILNNVIRIKFRPLSSKNINLPLDTGESTVVLFRVHSTRP
jgi:hypothetical protein